MGTRQSSQDIHHIITCKIVPIVMSFFKVCQDFLNALVPVVFDISFGKNESTETSVIQ